MPRRDNPVLGTITCNGCGGVASVHQTQRGKGRFLYTRCGECGADQRTGRAIQARLWNETEWREGAEKVRPPNVDEKSAENPVEITSEPEAEPVAEPEAKKQSKPSKAGPLAVLGVVVLGALAFVS